MKKKLWIVCVAAMATTLLAQDTNTGAPAPQPAPETAPATEMPATQAPATEAPATQPAPAIEASTNAPAKPAKGKKKKGAKKKTVAAHKAAPPLQTVPLVAGPAVVSANHVNVRSKAGLVGEIITRMTNGEPVTVVEEVTLKKSGPEEPSAWAKIALPADAHVWVKSSYIDANNTVNAKKLKMRAGPGENYGVAGILNKGEVVQPITTKNDWTQIQAPTNAYAFIASAYLTQSPEALAAATPTTPATVPEATNEVAAPPTNEVAMANTETNQLTTETNQLATGTNEVTMDTNQLTTMETAPTPPPPPRIVSHEGIVRATVSIQAPTRFELISLDTHKAINYLYPPTPNLDMSRYKGMHIIVTGEEGLDERWRNTPVITVQKIQVLE
jgi:uncharacterized protein YgiM (DUF1202 family)